MSTTTTTSKGNRIIEILAVVLLGIATIGTGVVRLPGQSGGTVARAELTRDAAIVQTEAARLFGLATQTVSYDSNILAQYAQAASAGDQRLMAFYRQSLVRPAMLPLLDEWEQQVRGEAPTNLLQDEDYLAAQTKPYEAEVAKAGSITVESGEAGDHANAYVLTTLLLAVALFFSGLTTSFRVRLARVFLLAGASLTIAYAASRLIELPIA